MKFIFTPLLAFIFVIVSGTLHAQHLNDRINRLGNRILEQSKTLGSYVSIIKDGKVIYSSAFGYNDPDSKMLINDSTIFPISSNTKAFNSILLSQLVEKEQLDFDAPIKTYLPKLEFNDEYITKNITLTDLLTHRWGLPRYDFTYFLMSEEEEKRPNKTVFNKLKYLTPSAPFRTQFSYGNNQYVLAAYLLEEITHTKWENQLDRQLLKPLNMHDTHCDLDRYLSSKNKSFGYQNKSEADIMHVAPLYKVSGMGNMFSTIRDLEKWAAFLLKDNSDILSKEYVDYTLSSHFNLGFEEPFEGFSHMGYGFGWFIFDYFGHKVVLHHGDNIGHKSIVVLLPDDNISFVMVANEGMSSYGFPFAMSYSLLDLFLDRDIADWCDRLLPMDEMIKEEHSTEMLEPTAFPLENYCGEYAHEGFGTIKVYMNDIRLMVKVGAYVDLLEPWKANTFIAYAEEFMEESTFEFIVEENKIIGLRTNVIEPTVDPIEFKKTNFE